MSDLSTFLIVAPAMVALISLAVTFVALSDKKESERACDSLRQRNRNHEFVNSRLVDYNIRLFDDLVAERRKVRTLEAEVKALKAAAAFEVSTEDRASDEIRRSADKIIEMATKAAVRKGGAA